QKAHRSTSTDRPSALVPSIERFGRRHRPVRGHAPLGRAAPHGTASGGHVRGRPRLSNKTRRIRVRTALIFLFVSPTARLRSLVTLRVQIWSRAPALGPARASSPESRSPVSVLPRLRDLLRPCLPPPAPSRPPALKVPFSRGGVLGQKGPCVPESVGRHTEE